MAADKQALRQQILAQIDRCAELAYAAGQHFMQHGKHAPSSIMAKADADAKLVRLIDEYAVAGGWCTHCGCGNDAAGYAHAPLCQRPAGVDACRHPFCAAGRGEGIDTPCIDCPRRAAGVQPTQAPSDALRVAVRTAWLAGTDDFRRHYDEELFKVLGITGFQDLYEPSAGVQEVKRG